MKKQKRVYWISLIGGLIGLMLGTLSKSIIDNYFNDNKIMGYIISIVIISCIGGLLGYFLDKKFKN